MKINMRFLSRYITIILVLTTILSFTPITYLNSLYSYAIEDNSVIMNNVSVFIDDEYFNPNKDFYNVNSRTLAPMRSLFEKLGATVTWEGQTKTITAETEDKIIIIAINSNEATVNGVPITLSAPPLLINNTTYVPLRFIAESFDYNVDWDGDTKTINISNQPSASRKKYYDKYSSSNYYMNEYINMEMIDNNLLMISGAASSEKTNGVFTLNSPNTHNALYNKVFEIGKDKNYNEIINLDSISDGDYEICIYFNKEYQDSYRNYYDNIDIKITDGKLYFPVSPVYYNNYSKYSASSNDDPSNYLTLKTQGENEIAKIKNIANNITKNAYSNYDKVKCIADWVSDNIYYDYDSLKNGTIPSLTDIETLSTKTSVCQGYAELTTSLLRAAGIPARMSTGFALGITTEGDWKKVDSSKSNHAWNEAYVNGRWVIIDTTWNSSNKYENGQYIKGSIKSLYFDPSIEAISYTHKFDTYR